MTGRPTAAHGIRIRPRGRRRGSRLSHRAPDPERGYWQGFPPRTGGNDGEPLHPEPAFGPPPDPIQGGVITFLAANGDAIEVTYTGEVGPLATEEGAPIQGVLHVTITGGTSRFDGATGHAEMTLEGVLHFTSPVTATWTWQGVIDYQSCRRHA